MILTPQQAAFNKSQADARSETVADAIRSAVPDGADLVALDYGSGPGHIGLRLADHFRHIILADPDAAALAVAAEAARDLPNVSLSLLGAGDDGLTALRADVVVSSLAWHHVRDLDTLLDALPVVAPAGQLLVADMDQDGGAYHVEIPDFDGVDGFDRTELCSRLVKHGYLDVTIRDLFEGQKWIAGQLVDLSLFMLQARIPAAT